MIVISAAMATSPGKVAEIREAEFTTMKAYGLAGERLRACVGNQVAAKDTAYLAFPFTLRFRVPPCPVGFCDFA